MLGVNVARAFDLASNSFLFEWLWQLSHFRHYYYSQFVEKREHINEQNQNYCEAGEEENKHAAYHFTRKNVPHNEKDKRLATP